MCCSNKKHIGLLFLRAIVGLSFLLHGLHKLMHRPDAIDFFTSLFGTSGKVLMYVTSITEVVGGAMLILGIFTCYASAVLAVVIAVAAVKVKFGLMASQVPFETMSVFDGIATRYFLAEVDILLFFGLLSVMFLGSGPISLHKWCACKCHALAQKCGLCKAVGCAKEEDVCHAGQCHDHGHSHDHGEGHTHA